MLFKKNYFISFTFNNNGASGAGNCDYRGKIRNHQDVKAIEKMIMVDNNLQVVVITNFKEYIN